MKNQQCSDWQGKTQKNTRTMAIWTAIWVLSVALAGGGPQKLWDYALVPTLLALLANIGVGIGMILATIRYFNGLDEMMRKIHFESLAMACGLTVVFGIAYELLEDIKLMSGEPQVSFVVIFISLTYLFSVTYRVRKYQ